MVSNSIAGFRGSFSHPIVVAITGASGAPYARRLLEVLLNEDYEVHLAISPSGKQVIRQELEIDLDLEDFDPTPLVGELAGVDQLHYHRYHDFMAPIASGSHFTAGMVVCPCSGSTLSAIATAASNNLIQRAAEVHLKERRKLILVPRETPLSLPNIENMKRCYQAGAVILPAMPGWYHGVESVSDLIDFVVARILSQLHIEHDLTRQWGCIPHYED
jgi:4-hydroxy-3-polyprenylbenzoate decarboxylase